MRSFVVFPALLALTLASCNTNKKAPVAAQLPAEPSITLDTITVSSRTVAPREIYRGSNPRDNDIIHTKLEVSFDWNKCRMNGKATLKLKPYFYAVSELFLNARGMDINKVEVYEIASVTEKKKVGKEMVDETVDIWNRILTSTYKYENDSIKIQLGRNFTAAEVYYVVIDYVAKPNELKSKGGSNAISEDKGLYFINPTGENPYKMPQIWTQGETQSSSVWFPTIDSPNERMTQEIFMTVEDKFITLSNGSLVDSRKIEGGQRIDHWKLDLPHAPYLAMMAVGQWKKVTDAPWNNVEVSYYVDEKYEANAKAIFGDTREMIDFFSKKLGVPYAWPKYSQIVARDYVSGAMENTSATLHGDFMVYQTPREMVDYKKSTGVVAHELFHQWFGDLVTCESWSNLPLNESFATYSEYLWEEYKNGRESADEHHWQSRQGYMNGDKDADLIRFHYKDKEDMFDAISYNKGGQVLHMLRKYVGDDAFFAGLKNYLETNKFKSVEIHNLRLAFEETLGEDLNWFFNQWFLNSGRPKLKVTLTRLEANKVELKLEQNQDLTKLPLYKLPVKVDVYSNGKADRHKLIFEEQTQTFTLSAGSEIQLVNFDAERQLLCDLTYKKNPAELMFQYRTCPLYVDRLEALKGLENMLGEPPVFDLLRDACQMEKVPSLRAFALSKIERIGPDRAPELKTILLEMYANDKSTIVRAKTLAVLNKRFSADPDVKELNLAALKESSYMICGEAINMLAKTEPTLALVKAKAFEKETGKDILFPVANLYADHGGDAQVEFFHEALGRFNGFEVMSYIAVYAKAAKKFDDAANAITAAQDMELVAKGSNKFVKYAAAKGIHDLITVWDNKGNILQTQVDAAKKDNKDASVLEKKLIEAQETKSIINGHYEKTK